MVAQIKIVNRTEALTSCDMIVAINALQTQIDRDLLPAWNVTASLQALDRTQAPSPSDWVVSIENESPEPGLYGYHDVCGGVPFARVFVGRNLDRHWSVTASHEILEMLVNPFARACVVQTSGRSGTAHMMEICDPVMPDLLSYEIDGVRVSNFVYPAWFEAGAGGPYDHLRMLSQPLQVAVGASVLRMDIGRSCQGWKRLYS